MNDSYFFYTDQLQGEYREAFDQIEMFVGTEQIDELTREEQLSQLLDVFLSAQAAGKPVKQIVGSDMEQFCRTFCSGYGWKNKVLNVLDYLKTQAWIMLVFSGIDIGFVLLDWLDGTIADAEVMTQISDLNVSGYVFGTLIVMISGFIASMVVRWAMFRSKRISMKGLKTVSAAAAVVSGIIMFLLIMSEQTDVIKIPAWVLALGSAVYIIAYNLCNRERFQEQKRGKVRFRDMVDVEAARAFPEEMDKVYEKANMRSMKRGKGPLPLEAYLEKTEKECGRMEKQKWLFYLFPPAAAAVTVLIIGIGEGFASAWDVLLVAGVMLAIECPLMLGIWRFQKKAIRWKRDWIRYKREN